jgi:hypothetical protein
MAGTELEKDLRDHREDVTAVRGPTSGGMAA